MVPFRLFHFCMFIDTGIVVKLSYRYWSKLAGLGQIDYRQTSNMRRPKSQILNVSRLVLQPPLCNPLKPSVKSNMTV